MKHLYLRILCAVLCALVCISSLALTPVTAADVSNFEFSEEVPFIMYEDERGYHFLGPTGELSLQEGTSSYSNYESATNKADVAQTGADAPLPDYIDNSQTKYFPPIGNQQGLGSCATWACVYYQFTYEVNRLRDTCAKDTFIASPKFVYNVINHGMNSGTLFESSYRMLQSFGAPSIDALPYDDNYLDWSATDTMWREAARNRLDDYYVFPDVGLADSQITSPDDPDLAPIKAALANGQVLTYSAYISSWTADKLKSNPDAPENDKFEGEMVTLYQDGYNGPHRMTMVGYNDNLWCDINRNDKIDEGEMGAFKVANSYSDGYANDGFIWLAYDALNAVSAVDGVVLANKSNACTDIASITVKPYNEGADLYLKYTLNTTDRTQMKVTVYAERNGTILSHQMFWGVGFISDVNKYAFDGTTEACDGTIATALDVIVPGITSASLDEYSWSIVVEDTNSDGVPTKLVSAEITDDTTGVSYKTDYSEPIVLDGSSLRIDFNESNLQNAVIYYVGYDNPTLHYKEGDGDWISVPMQENMENRGYIYKHVIESTKDEIKLYFSDENGNKDDNNSLYYTADSRLNYYFTKGVREELRIENFTFSNGTPDVNKRMNFEVCVKGGYEPYRYQYKVENLDTGDVTEYDTDVYLDHSHQFTREGNYRITTLITDYSNTTATYTYEFAIKDVPFIFSELYAGDEKHFTGKNIHFTAKSEFEGLYSYAGKRNTYDFVIKDESGNTVYSINKISDSYNMNSKTSESSLDWIAPKSGKYSITISSTALNNEYAEKTIEFTVYDKLYGDADGNSIINVKDATIIQKHVADIEITTDFYKEMADCDISGQINVKDATLIQKFVAAFENTGETGNPIPYTPPVVPTEPTEPTEPSTSPATEPQPTDPVPETHSVTFTNSFRWEGQIYCYYWSEGETFIGWPGTPMKKISTNEYGEDVYYLQLPYFAEYVIFSNGSIQTTDIPFEGGDIRYYPITETDHNGRNKVNTW